MKKLFMLATMMLMVLTSIFAQDVTTVTFTGEQQNKAYQKLDSVLVTNLSQNWSEVVYYPDTLILLSNVGITDYESRNGKVHLYQNIPNPFHGITNFNLSLANKEKVDLVIYDISGRKVAEYHNTLPSGEHQFRAAMDIPQTYLLSALSKSGTTSIKMINLSNTGEKANIELISSLPLASDAVKYKSQHGFKVGDEMKYVGYATQNDGVKDAEITKAQTESETLTFVFPTEVFKPIVTVTTGEAGNIDFTSATLTGTYTAKNTEIKETGFEYKMSKDEKFEKFLSMDIISPFSVTIKTLNEGTEYTYKAYVKTAEDSIVYGEEKTFTTEKIKETVVTTTEPTEISKRSATFHGSYELGTEKLMMVGFELKKADDKEFEVISTSSTVETPFQYTYSEQLEPGTEYVCRAFVLTQLSKTIYGNEVKFRTAEAEKELPVVKTVDVNIKEFNGTKAILYGEVVSEGYCKMQDVGFYVGKTEKPQDEKEAMKIISSIDKFQSETEVLEPATVYYGVAFASNEVGTAYGDAIKFETRQAGAAPELAVVKVTPFATSAEVSCSVTAPFVGPDVTTEPIIEKGICYSEKENPTVADTKVAAADNKYEDFVATMNNLKENATFYVRAYAQVFGSTVYSAQEKVTTITLTKPEVQTVSIDNVGSTSAIITSKLLVSGGSENLSLGVRVFNEDLKFDSIYVTSNPLAADNTFSTKVSQLKKSTQYSVQAYAENEAGKAFGEIIPFTTTANFGCGDMISDIEGNEYKTVEIGKQCWMAEDMRTKTMPNGKKLTLSREGTNPSNYDASAGDYLWYFEVNNEVTGLNILYPWSTAAGVGKNTGNDFIQGICPDGWHLPSATEFQTMFNTIDPEIVIGQGVKNNTAVPSNNKLGIKLALPQGTGEGYGHWLHYAGPGFVGANKPGGDGPNPEKATVPNTPAYNFPDNQDKDFNISGFSAKPKGYKYRKDNKYYFNGILNLWTSYGAKADGYAVALKIGADLTGYQPAYYTDIAKDFYSVRCIMNPEPEKAIVKTLEPELKKYDELGAMLYGEIVSDGYTDVKEIGFYFGKNADPVTNGEKLQAADLTKFQYELPTLDSATTYYYVAYVTNTVGTAYGQVVSFTTRDKNMLPTVKTSKDVTVYATSAEVTGTLVKDGGEKMNELGFCFGEKANPTIENDKVVKMDKAELGDFNAELTGLTIGTTYNVRAYAINTVGIAYGENVEFTTTGLTAPEVITLAIPKVETFNATATGKLTVQGGDVNLEAGFVYSDAVKEPTLSDNSVAAYTINADSTFSAMMIDLKKLTTYYVRAYAKNKAGIAYGEVKEFTTVDGFDCGDLLKDIEGNTYKTVKIGKQCWMQENLRTKTMPDGTPMQFSAEGTAPSNFDATTGNCWYFEIENEIAGHAVLYPWGTATNVKENSDQTKVIRGICPEGWHIPSGAEFQQLFQFVDPSFPNISYGGNGDVNSTNKLGIKLALPQGTGEGYGHWLHYAGPGFVKPNDHTMAGGNDYANVPNTPGYNFPEYKDDDFNASDFCAKPQGYKWRDAKTNAYYFNGTLNLWTSISTSINGNAEVIKIAMNKTGIVNMRASDVAKDFYSVRCIMDGHPTLAEVQTFSVNIANYDSLGASVTGRITSEGFCKVLETGFVLGTDPDPIHNGKKYACENLSQFTHIFENLNHATTYYVAAYAINEAGTSYGKVLSFTTREAGKLASFDNVKAEALATSAQLSANLVSDGGEKLSELGFCYGEQKDPTIENDIVVKVNVLTSGEFTAEITELEPNKVFYVRPYAINIIGTAYGESVEFNTIELIKPEVMTVEISKVDASSATATGKLTVHGGDANIEVGFVYSDAVKEPTLADNKVVATPINADNTFSTVITGLKKSTSYFVRAYAKNEKGESYGEVKEFSTTAGFSCGNSIFDIENNSYKTVKIGNRCWMQENLRTHTYADGTALATAKYKDYEDTEYGLGTNVYYTWPGATNIHATLMTDNEAKVQGICPAGWRVPNYNDVTDLTKAIDADISTVTANTSTADQPVTSNNKLAIKLCQPHAHWALLDGVPATGTPAEAIVNNDPDLNQSKFSALPSGYISQSNYVINGYYFLLCNNSSKAANDGYGRAVNIMPNETGFTVKRATVLNFYNVRCVSEDGLDAEEEQEAKSCNGDIIIEESGSWPEAEVTFTVTHPDGTEETLINKEQLLQLRTEEFEFSKISFLAKCKSFDPDMMHFIVEVYEGSEFREFTSNTLFDKFKGEPVVKFSYTCGDKEPVVSNKE